MQDAFLRWLDADRDAVREPAAFLRRVVTRLCLDRLKSARHQRETYVGTWLPEPVVESGEAELDDVTLPLLMALERLSPLERAAFLLHDVFGLDFERESRRDGRARARRRAGSLASRAREHIRADRPRYPVAKERGLEIAAGLLCGVTRAATWKIFRIAARSRRHRLRRRRRRQGDGAHITPVAGLDNVMRLFDGIRRLLCRRTRRASCAMASSTACRDSSPSRAAAFSRPPRCRSRMAVSSRFTPRAIPTSCGTWPARCIEATGQNGAGATANARLFVTDP